MTSTDRQFSAGTVDDSARDKKLYTFKPAGKKSGHGAIAWLPAPDYDVTAATVVAAGARPPSGHRAAGQPGRRRSTPGCRNQAARRSSPTPRISRAGPRSSPMMGLPMNAG